MSKYKAVIFDCDGVLVDSELIGNRVLVDLANNYGANIDLEYALKHFKGNAMDICVEKIKTLVKEELPSDFIETYRTQSFEAFRNEIQPVKGVAEVLKGLTIPFCVASSGPENKIRLNLELTGLLPYFEGKIFSCYSLKKWKPEPDIFLVAAKALGVTPDECLVIEDSVLGVQAAKRGGFDVFGYTEYDHNNELPSLVTKSFNDMKMLQELMKF